MKRAVLTPCLAAAPLATAQADDFSIKPLLDARLRYERSNQEGVARDAHAVTLRARFGAEAKYKWIPALVEGEGTVAPLEKYFSGVNGKADRPIIADPENIELNRAQVQITALPKTAITLGRQRINLDDQRFVGSVGWRQNEQTFDSARIEWSGVENLKVDLTYAWNVRTIWGIDGRDGRPQGIDGDNVFANISYKTPFGTLTGFAYVVDAENAAVVRNASKTFGARFVGAYPVAKAFKLNYAASYASQTDSGRNPNDYQADYYLVEGGADIGAFKLGAGYEVLGADNGVAQTSFQTPLATLHKFHGTADVFLVTPPNGIRDVYGSAGYGWKQAGPFANLSLNATYHNFRSDRADQRYGDELDLQATAKIGKFGLLAKYATYDGAALAPTPALQRDLRKLWFSIEYQL